MNDLNTGSKKYLEAQGGDWAHAENSASGRRGQTTPSSPDDSQTESSFGSVRVKRGSKETIENRDVASEAETETEIQSVSMKEDLDS